MHLSRDLVATTFFLLFLCLFKNHLGYISEFLDLALYLDRLDSLAKRYVAMFRGLLVHFPMSSLACNEGDRGVGHRRSYAGSNGRYGGRQGPSFFFVLEGLSYRVVLATIRYFPISFVLAFRAYKCSYLFIGLSRGAGNYYVYFVGPHNFPWHLSYLIVFPLFRLRGYRGVMAFSRF